VDLWRERVLAVKQTRKRPSSSRKRPISSGRGLSLPTRPSSSRKRPISSGRDLALPEEGWTRPEAYK